MTGRRVIGVEERPTWPEALPLSLQHLFAMFGCTRKRQPVDSTERSA